MAQEHGFEFKISGTVFVPRKSAGGADIMAALTEASEIRAKIQAELMDVPAEFTVTEPRARSRRAPDLFKGLAVGQGGPGDRDADGNPNPPAEDGATPALDLPSKAGEKK